MIKNNIPSMIDSTNKLSDIDTYLNELFKTSEHAFPLLQYHVHMFK